MYAPHHLLYPVAKAGLEAATRSMAAHLAYKNIRVNDITITYQSITLEPLKMKKNLRVY